MARDDRGPGMAGVPAPSPVLRRACDLLVVLFVLIAPCRPLAASDALQAVVLRAPMTTTLALPAPQLPPGGAGTVTTTITVPDDAPADLGVGLWLSDPHGRWYQCSGPPLHPGTAQVAFVLGAGLGPQADGHGATWTAVAAAASVRAGVYFWSASTSRCRLLVGPLRLAGVAPAMARTVLCDTTLPRLGADRIIHLQTGQRWSMTTLPAPMPENPYDPAEFALALLITDAQGRSQRYAAFYDQEMRSSDRGDSESVLPTRAGCFAVRYRPQLPGTYRAVLEAHWASGAVVSVPLPAIVVSGAPWDEYVRVDRTDPRYFSVGTRWWWPIGPNLRSVWDRRCQQYLGTMLTPDRLLGAYHDYFARLSGAGVNSVEIWLSSWNLALEWRGDWNGYDGMGRYSEANAWRLDQVLDDAWAHGIRVTLVIDNHGKASTGTDHEWENHPYNRAAGGFLDDALGVFTDARALHLEQRLRGYLIARYADHPAVMAWKLWSEINLTVAGDQPRIILAWHQDALAAWHREDPYHHPCTTHWAGNYRSVDHAVAGLSDLDFICIDAYHLGPDQEQGSDLAMLMANSVGSGERRNDLARLHKPIYVTEYGGNWDACPPAQLEAEHASGAFLALVDGQAGAPMLWWFEWIDQGARYAPYHAITGFLAGEDLRDARGASVPLIATSLSGELWARAWARPGRMLGYVLDRAWGAHGGPAREHPDALVEIGASIAPGTLQVSWWDADRGVVRQSETLSHSGGELSLVVPPFSRHLAFKLVRVAGAAPRNGTILSQ